MTPQIERLAIEARALTTCQDTEEGYLEIFANLIILDVLRAYWLQSDSPEEADNSEYLRNAHRVRKHFGLIL